jgi:PucR-like helix-turn-helix protein
LAADGLQQIVDALSVRLQRPVLVDDVELRPLAYSSQTGELDFVRTASILGRHAPDSARAALFAHGIRNSPEPVRIPAHPEIPMSARVCVPISRAGRPLGFLWLLEDPPVETGDLQLARTAASQAAAVLQSDADARIDRHKREQELVGRLVRGDAAAGEALEADNYLPQRPLAVSIAAASGEDLLDRIRARALAKHALAGEVDGRIVYVASAQVALRGSALSDLLDGAIVGESDEFGDLRDAPRSYRRALAALRVAGAEPAGVARWTDMRAARLLTALPETAFDDVPPGLRTLMDGGNDQLVLTLETYLDHAGDVKSTAAALWLHRTSLYYRLRRIEELAGVDLSNGEDRLLCHLALRLAKLAA